MMTYDDIERILGDTAVRRVEAAVAESYAAVRNNGGDSSEAVRALLVALLGTAIMTPPEHAEERLDAALSMLTEIVRESMRGGSAPRRATTPVSSKRRSH